MFTEIEKLIVFKVLILPITLSCFFSHFKLGGGGGRERGKVDGEQAIITSIFAVLLGRVFHALSLLSPILEGFLGGLLIHEL